MRGQAAFQVRVQSADFDPAAESQALCGAGCGAVVSFVGLVRDGSADFDVAQIELEHYPGMTERALGEIAARAVQRWPGIRAGLVHRYGVLKAGERIVWVGVASEHRDAAFEACRFIIDQLKTQAPFWKRESGAQGSRWVAARDSDERARERWEAPPSGRAA
jgi:molybdopterin synthase catalytic subunit